MATTAATSTPGGAPGTTAGAVQGGRRERAKRDKQERIFSAASELFSEHGFDKVTTQQVAERADVGAGTLFRYASTKGELFLMVYNERLASAVAEGARAAGREQDCVAAVFALVEPVLTWARTLGAAADYQRELLFGARGMRFRDTGLAVVAELESEIAELLLDGRGARDDRSVQGAQRAARTVFAVLNLLLVQPLNDLHTEADPALELREQISQVVHGYLVTTEAAEAPAVP